MFITRDEKERRVIDLYSQGKTYRQIVEEVRISPNDIHTILKKKEEKNNSIVTNNRKHPTSLIAAKAYELFNEKKSPLQVAITLNLGQPEVTKLYRGYWKLKRLHILNLIYKETNGKLWPFLKLYTELIKKRRMSIEQVVNAVDIAVNRLPYMETLYEQVKDQAEKMQRTIQRLANDIRALERKISILDKIAFSIEQDCRRKHQEIRELTEQKNRIERLIANLLNGEGYSKLNQIVKENVKAVLSDNKIIISTAFAAVIQTLTADPQMVKLIQNMPTKNDGEQHKDNHINIYQYIESNKDRILDLAENNYKNLVEVLTKHTIDIAASASSSSLNPTLSLLHSLSTFSNSLDQNDTYRIEEPESFHNSKGDISD